MARIQLREGVRFLFKKRVYQIKKNLYGGVVEVEDVALGVTYPLDRDRLTRALFSGELKFEVPECPAAAPPEYGLRTDYRLSDFSALPPKQQLRAWRRYVVVCEVLKIPAAERSRKAVLSAIADAVKKLKEEEHEKAEANGVAGQG